MEYITHSPEETGSTRRRIRKSLKAGDVVAFSGDLGAGKTAFTRGVLHGLGYEGRVTSPTFAIANEYETPTVKVAHFDLYRILDSEALFEIGLTNISTAAALCSSNGAKTPQTFCRKPTKPSILPTAMRTTTAALRLEK